MPTKKQSYEEAYSQLQEILEKIEDGDLNVDELASQVKKASELIKFCKSKLFETESEIEKILEDLETEE
ncbi:MAG: exodeoxyribonuclease VII small subunit [Bacteroidales bacterium]|nr:exodeoxyribonuclease VII small subunit [Bacteroidales bacterium]MBN2817669.1 exodeoxyribonuclease VII small subunit [Bacteroidales bacterium]